MNCKNYKVVIIISRFNKCGPMRQLLSIIEALESNSVEVYVLTLFAEKEESNLDTFRELNIHIKQANIKSNRNFFKIRKAISNYVKEIIPNIVYSYGLSANYYTTRAIKNKKLYCTFRNNAYVDFQSEFGGFIGKIGEKMIDYVIKHTNYIICCSEFLQSVYQKRFPQKTIYCIQNGVDIEKFAINEKRGIDLRKKLGFHKKIIFLVSGSLIMRKNPMTIIEAFKKANIDDVAALIFVGTGEMEQQCKIKAKGGSIYFLGFVDNVEEYYQMADVYISASYSEGLPNSVLEAAGCGCRMILSDIPQHKEIFRKNQKFISYFQADDINSLKTLIKENTKSTKTEEKEMMNQFIAENFSNKIMAKKYYDFFFPSRLKNGNMRL